MKRLLKQQYFIGQIEFKSQIIYVNTNSGYCSKCYHTLVIDKSMRTVFINH